jgi:phosphonopyruvate decarboxylase
MKDTEFLGILKSEGFNFFVGVPCSILKGFINAVTEDAGVQHVRATREEEAIGIAVGAYLGGQKPVVYMQNSGFGNSIDALTSLPQLYRIPLLLVISWRGYRGKDFPEHVIMGKNTRKLLRDAGIPTEILSKGQTGEELARIVEIMDEKQVPAAVLIRDGVLS